MLVDSDITLGRNCGNPRDMNTVNLGTFRGPNNKVKASGSDRFCMNRDSSRISIDIEANEGNSDFWSFIKGLSEVNCVSLLPVFLMLESEFMDVVKVLPMCSCLG